MARNSKQVSSEIETVSDGIEQWDIQEHQTTSDTHLEDDKGEGGAAIIRMFEFGANPEAFKQYTPTKQELFNSHFKGIEMLLWRDGMSIMTEVNPTVTISKNKKNYRIFVGAKPMKGHILREQPKKLSELV